MRPGTLLRLAIAGTRTDTMRIVLTGLVSALGTLALLAAATVLTISGGDPGGDETPAYTNELLRESGLRPGVAFALALLTVPVLLLVGQCARLGAPARDRRLAAIRLAGATPRQGLALVAAESGVATLIGGVLGLAAYLAGRRLLDARDANGLRPLPTDVLPPSWALAAIVLCLPVIAALATALMLRRVTATPLGVVRRVRAHSPRPWPGVLIVLGVAVYALIEPVLTFSARHGDPLPTVVPALALFLGALCAALGVISGVGWISHTIGRLLVRYARRPAALIAGRRLQADPWSGSRALAALLAAAVFAGGAAWVTSWFRTNNRLANESQRLYDLAMGQTPFADGRDDFYLRAMQLVGYAVLVAGLIAAAGLLVAVANSIVDRRRALASLTASGVPRSVLGRAVLWQSLAVAVPALVLALTTGVALARGYFTPTITNGAGSVSICTPPPEKAEVCDSVDIAVRDAYTTVINLPEVTGRTPIPWADLGAAGGWALGATVLATGLGLVFLRSSTAPEELRTT